jgi:hypothetical protein
LLRTAFFTVTSRNCHEYLPVVNTVIGLFLILKKLLKSEIFQGRPTGGKEENICGKYFRDGCFKFKMTLM